jgi:hypothetical protein
MYQKTNDLLTNDYLVNLKFSCIAIDFQVIGGSFF